MNTLKEFAYKTIDLMTLGKGIRRTIGGADLRLPSRLSRFYTPDYEPETVDYFRRQLKPGETLFDIGAHIGLFTVLGAQIVGKEGRVVSFEPTPVTRRALTDIVKLNDCSEIVIIRGEAVSRKRGTAIFFDSGENISVTNSLVRNETTEGKIEVPTISVDEWVTDTNIQPDCMKIDVEGAELDVLYGAQVVLRDIRPKLRLSLHPPFHSDSAQTLGDVWRLLKEFAYFADFNGRVVEREWFCSQRTFFDVNLTPLD
jgi:FkbM family methyltransferase